LKFIYISIESHYFGALYSFLVTPSFSFYWSFAASSLLSDLCLCY